MGNTDNNKEKTNRNVLSQQQMNIETTKFAPPVPEERLSRFISLPYEYGRDRIMAMVRDPWWIFAYWEITENAERRVRDEIAKNSQTPEKSALRVYDISGVKNFNGKNANKYFDITLGNMAKNWYINTANPGAAWCVEIGIATREGGFFALARSNMVRTPRFGMSDILDEQWMCMEDVYWTLFGMSGGFDVGKSSMEMREMFQRYLQEWVSSGGINVSSFGSQFFPK